MSTISLPRKAKMPNNTTNSDLNNVRFVQSPSPMCRPKIVFKFTNNVKSRFLMPIKKSIHFSPPNIQKFEKINTVKIVDINRDIYRRVPPYQNPNKFSKPPPINKNLSRNSMSHLSRLKIQTKPFKYYPKLLSIHTTRKRNNFAPILSYDFPKQVESCKIKYCSPLSISGICITPKGDGKAFIEITRKGSP